MGPGNRQRFEGVGAVVIGVALCLSFALLATSSAHAASFEQVGCFGGSLPGPGESCKPVKNGEFGEEAQLGGLGALAVNYTGAGGVPKGTVYAVTSPLGEPIEVAMYEPVESDGGLKFSVSWEVGETAGPTERCGPLLGTENVGGKEVSKFPCQPRPGVETSPAPIDIEVDQSTGNVYVLRFTDTMLAGRKAIVEYKADGSEEITRFGEKAAEGKTIAETPAQVHVGLGPGGLAVTGSGAVYMFDQTNVGPRFHRLMVFAPCVSGDFSNYCYQGEVLAGPESESNPIKFAPVADEAGDLYVLNSSKSFQEYAPQTPAPFSPTPPPVQPLCEYEFASGGLTAMTVDPPTGEPFFFSYKTPRRVRRLGSCDPVSGQFQESAGEPEAFTASPERGDLWGLAFDPVRKFSPSRDAGVLYGAAPNPTPALGEGEPGQSALGYIFAPTEENPPAILTQSFVRATAVTAQLRAKIDPRGRQTHYAFEYMTRAAYEEDGESFAGAASAPLGGAQLKETGTAEEVGVTLTNLQPGVMYVWRVVASSRCKKNQEESCPAEGAPSVFRTFPTEARALPDGRAYELVSPAQKNGGQVLPADPFIRSCGLEECKPGQLAAHFPMQSTSDGEEVAYEGTSFGPGGATVENEYLAHRTEAGWRTLNLTPALLESRSFASAYRDIDNGLGTAVLSQARIALNGEAPPGFGNLYVQPTGDLGALRALLREEPPNRTAATFSVRYAGASSDFSRIFVEANDALTVGTPFAPAATDPGASKFNLYEWLPATGELRLVNVLPGNESTEAGASFGPVGAHSISADGLRAFWRSSSGEVYVREAGEVTRKIEDPEVGRFLAAATDGSRVLLDDGCLYGLQAETCEDLTLDQGAVHRGGFVGLVGQNGDLTHIYFVDTKVLTGVEENCREGMSEEVCEAAQEGRDNLYSWSEGSTRYVATLVSADAEDWAGTPPSRTAEASPQGRFLAFTSQSELTGYGNIGPCALVGETREFASGPCSEVFLFDSATGKLTCPSCNPSGAAPLGGSVLRRSLSGGAQPRYLTDVGRLFFDSRDSLSQLDTNNGVEDVYEFEPAGVGSCRREGGCVGLISAGREGVDSNFVTMDETGENVFFTTRDRLVSSDEDTLIDLYDARVGGGFSQESALPSGSCQDEACQSPPPEASKSPPNSVTFHGTGNVAPPKPCPKGKVKRAGKCVKKSRRHKKSHHHKKARHRHRSSAKNGGGK